MPDKRFAPDGNGNIVRVTKENSDGSYEMIIRPENSEGQERIHAAFNKEGEVLWWAETDKDGNKVGGNKTTTRFIVNTAVQVALGLLNAIE